jgi:superfamily II DNA or RNA helicase
MSNEFNTNVDDGNISVLSSKNKEIGDVNIATFQFLLKNPAIVQELAKEVGLVVVDECHTISIGAFTEIVNNLPAKYRLGLSATPSRSDGLTEALYDVMSRNIVEGNVKNPVKVTYLFIERPTFVPSIFYDKPNIEWGNFYATEVVQDDVVAVASKMVDYDRAVLVYSTYVKAQESYAKKLNELGIPAAVVNQHTSKKEKEAILQDFNDGKIKVLVSGVILQKGISIHRLDTVVNAGNLNKENIEQLIGRLRRKHPDKKNPIFIDLIYRGRGFTKGMQRLNFIRKIRETTKEELKYWVVATAEKRINEWKKTYLKG